MESGDTDSLALVYLLWFVIVIVWVLLVVVSGDDLAILADDSNYWLMTPTVFRELRRSN